MEFPDTAAPQDTEGEKKTHSSVTKTAINMCTFFSSLLYRLNTGVRYRYGIGGVKTGKNTRGIGLNVPTLCTKSHRAMIICYETPGQFNLHALCNFFSGKFAVTARVLERMRVVQEVARLI